MSLIEANLRLMVEDRLWQLDSMRLLRDLLAPDPLLMLHGGL